MDSSLARRADPFALVAGVLSLLVAVCGVLGIAPWEVVEAKVRSILDEGRAAPGHIFNLGHGVPPHTDPDVLTRIVEVVHEHSAR